MEYILHISAALCGVYFALSWRRLCNRVDQLDRRLWLHNDRLYKLEHGELERVVFVVNEPEAK